MIERWREKNERCMFCGKEPASFPINLPSEGNGYICGECVKQIPDYVFIRCSRCKATCAMEAEKHYKEDMIMEACFKRGMNKLDVEYQLITTQWTPFVLSVASCDMCEKGGD